MVATFNLDSTRTQLRFTGLKPIALDHFDTF